MSLIKSEDNKKWINFFVMAVSVLCIYLFIRFSAQMGEWFDLEAKIPSFHIVTQVLGIVVGLVIFLTVQKNEKASRHLNEVYAELVKVIWPDSESVAKATVGIVIGLTLLSGLFVGVDYLFRTILNMIY
tara:strand:- start:122 stop:508 length:387 start_codon:yes stop_codon:yes gene_type:complete